MKLSKVQWKALRALNAATEPGRFVGWRSELGSIRTLRLLVHLRLAQRKVFEEGGLYHSHFAISEAGKALAES